MKSMIFAALVALAGLVAAAHAQAQTNCQTRCVQSGSSSIYGGGSGSQSCVTTCF